MRLLLDTHVLVWWLDDDPRLGDKARRAIGHPRNEAAVSAATAWEISTKVALGKLRFEHDLLSVLRTNDFTPLPISVEHATAAGALPRHHGDPFDRLLIAQAVTEGLTVVTGDRRFGTYDVAVLEA